MVREGDGSHRLSTEMQDSIHWNPTSGQNAQASSLVLEVGVFCAEDLKVKLASALSLS
jgi:hypothetical protein